MKHALTLAFALSLSSAGACSSSSVQTDADAAQKFKDAELIRDDAGGPLDANNEDAQCSLVCTNPDSPCDYYFKVEELPFETPSGLPDNPDPITFELMEGAPAGKTGTAHNSDPRWGHRYYDGAWVPHEESFRSSIGIQAEMRETTDGPYRVHVAILVDYEFVDFSYFAPVPGRNKAFSEGSNVNSAVFQVPDFPVIVDFEIPSESLGDKGMKDIVFIVRTSTIDRTHAYRYVQRTTLFYGGNVPKNPVSCHPLGTPGTPSIEEQNLSRSSYVFRIDETTRDEQTERPAEWISSDTSSIGLTMLVPPSIAEEPVDGVPETLVLFRNEEPILIKDLARHSASQLDPIRDLSDRQELTIDLPVDDDRFSIWGFAIQLPRQPAVAYETGALNPDISRMVESASGSLRTATYRIWRRTD